MKTWAKFFLLGGSFVAALFFAEIFLRLFYPQNENTVLSPVEVFEKDPAKLPAGLKFAPKPNVPLHRETQPLENFSFTVKTNNLGLYQLNDYNNEAGPIVYVLGDSYSAGSMADMDKNYFSELQKLRPSYRWLNASVYGYGTYQETIRFKWLQALIQERAKPTSSVAILHFFIGNDFQDNALYQGRDNTRRQTLRSKIFLREKSHLYRLLRRSRRAWNNHKKAAEPAAVISCYESFVHPYMDGIDRNETKKALADLASYCRANNVQLLAILIPTKEMASKRAREKYTSQLGERVDFDFFRHEIQKILKEENIPTLDLTDFFLNRTAENLFFPKDGHWNEQGQKKAAAFVLTQFKEKLP